MDVNGVDRLGRTKVGDRAFVRNHIVGVCTPMSLRQASTQPLRCQRLSCSAKGGEGIDLQNWLTVNEEQESKRRQGRISRFVNYFRAWVCCILN